MQVKQLQESIKLKENEVCGESHRNDDCECKNWVMHATLGKGSEKIKTTILQDKKNLKCKWSFKKKSETPLSQVK